MSTISINCLVPSDGGDKIFTVKIPSDENISILKDLIKEKQPIIFSDTPATDIQLFKLKVSLAPEKASGVSDPLQNDAVEELSAPFAKISAIFKDLPDDEVHVIALSPTGTKKLDKEYQHLVMIAHTQGIVTDKDLKSSHILWVPSLDLSAPHVSKVVKFLERPRYLDENKGKDFTAKAMELHDLWKAQLPNSDNTPSSASSTARLTSPNESRDSDVAMSTPGSEETSSHSPERTQQGISSKPDETLYVCSEVEMLHIQTLSLVDFSLDKNDKSIQPDDHFNEDYANASIFFLFSFSLRSRPPFTFRFGRHSWLFNIYIRVDKKLCYYRPKSDFLLAYGGLPRFIVEVHSVGSKDDERRLKLQAAVVVRYANQHLERYKEDKDFFVVVVYITKEGKAICQVVYQDKTSDQVKYVIFQQLQLTIKTQLVHLLNIMYNLITWLENMSKEDPDQTQDKVDKMAEKLKDVEGASPWTVSKTTRKGPQDGFTPGQEPPTQKRKVGGHKDDFPERVGDYDVVPPLENFDLDDEAPHTPSNIRVVRKRSDRELDLVMKRSTSSNERQTLNYLQTLEPSPHIVPLFDSINDGAVTYYVFPRLRQVDRQSIRCGAVKEPCQGLVTGVAYLHENGIAHLDLKFDNLLYDSNTGFLMITDFDVSERVKDAEEEVEGFRGTEGWTAPEVGQEDGPTQMFSAIRADRWACGRILQRFFEAGCETEHRAYESLAEKLVVRDPKQRPSLVEWCKGPASQQAPPTQQLDVRRKYTDDCKVPMPPVKKMRLKIPQNMPVEAQMNRDIAV